MSWDGGQVSLRDARAGLAQQGGAVTLRPEHREQPSDDVVLVERHSSQPAPGDAIILTAPAAAPDEPEPDPYPPFRGPSLGVGAAWSRAAARTLQTDTAWRHPPPHYVARSTPWGRGSQVARDHTTPWGRLARRRSETRAPWPQTLDERRTEMLVPWGTFERVRAQTRAPWQGLEVLAPQREISYRHPPAKRQGLRLPSDKVAHRRRAEPALPWSIPPAKREHWRLPWGRGHWPVWDERPDEPEPPPPEPEPEPPYTPPAGDAVALDLHCPLTGSADLWIGFDCPPTEIGRTITMDNQITVERHADDEPVAVERVQLSTDIDSWTWDWQATLLGKPALQKLEHDANGPRAVRVTINGVEWVVLAEEYTEDRRWERTQRSTSGRGRAAYLAAPFAPAASGTETNDRTAQQLANDALEFTGWILQWEAPDWLIPGGTYSYQGQTPMERITRLAETVGAVVLSHPRDQTLIVRSRYPTSPWAWDSATPDVTIQASQIRSASSRWEPQQHHNRIFVAGRENGVLVRVTRDGSAGDLPAGQVVDELVTHVDAGRERGRVELSRAGDAAAVTLELPLLTGASQYGLLQPGQLAEIVDRTETWRGLVTAVQIDATRQSVSQSVEVERRFPDAA